MTHSAVRIAIESAPPAEPTAGAICVVVGTRPEVVKLAPVVDELRLRDARIDVLVTGQHTTLLDGMPSLGAVRELGLASRGHVAEYVTRARRALYDDFRRHHPAVVIVQGDTMSAFAAALAAADAGVPVAHVEAGVRSGNELEPWPEENIRREIDAIATWRYAPTAHALANLRREGLHGMVTGNTVVDALQRYTDAYPRPETSPTILVTLHRREFYTRSDAGGVLDAIVEGARLHPGVTLAWPVHPALRALAKKALQDAPPNLRPMDPLAYIAMADMLAGARGVLTDSGGVTEEAATLGVPTVVLRRVTDRPEALRAGIAVLLAPEPDLALLAVRVLAAQSIPRIPSVIYGDGHAARRIATHLTNALRARSVGA